MPRLIQDEFTSLRVSPQRRYQLRRAAAGLCRLCGAPEAHPGLGYCEKHYASQLGYAKRRRGSPVVARVAAPVLPDCI